MAIIPVGYRPELTPERAMEVFKTHLGGRYDVYETRQFGRHFILKKSAWTGVGVGLKQDQDGTYFVFTGITPSLGLRFLPLLGIFLGIIGVAALYLIMYLSLRQGRKEMEQEVVDLIQNAAEFH